MVIHPARACRKLAIQRNCKCKIDPRDAQALQPLVSVVPAGSKIRVECSGFWGLLNRREVSGGCENGEESAESMERLGSGVYIGIWVD